MVLRSSEFPQRIKRLQTFFLKYVSKGHTNTVEQSCMQHCNSGLNAHNKHLCCSVPQLFLVSSNASHGGPHIYQVSVVLPNA